MRSSPLLFILFLLTIATLARAQKQQANDEENNGIEDDELGEEGGKEEARPNGHVDVDLSHGFGTDIDWVGWPDAISIALDVNKPIFLLIHKTWCGACSALKKSFNTSNKRAELVELSQRFVMVNLEDDDEPEEEEYAPDGRYIPRLFILNKKGEPLAVDNAKNYPNNRQYFPQVPDVIKAMKKGLEILEGGGERKKEEQSKVPKEPKKMAKTEKEEEDSKKAKEEDLKAGGGCPHAAGKAAKKAAEEAAAKNDEKKTMGKGEKKVKGDQQQEKGTVEGKTGKKKDGEKEKEKKEQKNGKKKKEEAKEEL